MLILIHILTALSKIVITIMATTMINIVKPQQKSRPLQFACLFTWNKADCNLMLAGFMPAFFKPVEQDQPALHYLD